MHFHGGHVLAIDAHIIKRSKELFFRVEKIEAAVLQLKMIESERE